MRLVTQLPDFFRAGVFFQLAIFIAVSLTRRYVISSSSIRVTLLVMLLISTFISPGQTVDQDLSFIESFLRILTSLSAFVISESPSIVILILTDKSVISIIQPRMERVFLVYRTPTSSLVTSNHPNWSELPTDTIGEILNRLPYFMDIKAIPAVCKQWRSACSETETTRTPPVPVPLLMLSERLDDSNTRRRFFNLCDSRRGRLELSTIRGKRCWGSPHGWVVTLDPDYDIHIENLDQRIEPIALPPLNTIQRLAAREEWFRLVHKFIIFKDPSPNQLSFLVMAIFGPMNRLAFSRVGEAEVGLNRRGQGEWVIVANPNDLKFKDVARFKDQLYGLCDNGTLVRFELDAPWSAGLVFIAPQPQDVGEPQKLYLVESLENLYGVFRYGFYIPTEKRHETISFLIYKFNFSALHWEEVTDLEDHAVFVGDGYSWCIPTSSINIRSNTIYFTDDNWDSQMLAGGHDVGVFDMESRVIQWLPFAGSGNEFAAEDEGEFDAVEAAESASAAIQSPFASLERLGVEISAVPAEILSFFQEFDRVAISRHRPQHFWIFDSAEVDFYDYSVPRDGIQFLEAIWKKYGNFISNFRLGNFVGGAMLTLLCCVLMQMRNTSLEDVTETNILEWKGVVQELIQEGFLLGFMIDHLREIARDMFGRRLTAELKALEARVVAMRNAVTAIVPAHWHLTSAMRAAGELCNESALYGLLE